MPLLNPQDLNRLIAVETKRVRSSGTDEKEEVKDILENNGMGLDNVVAELASIVRTGDTDGVRLQAIKTGLELHKALKGEENTAPVINIIIKDSQVGAINPILIPRMVPS